MLFEDNELYGHYHFITNYLASNDNFENCEKIKYDKLYTYMQ